MKLNVSRLEGAGNSFLLAYVDQNSDIMSKIAISDFVRKSCSEQNADGFIFLQPFFSEQFASASAPKEFKWYFYNRDGSEAEMCGNAARCVGHFLVDLKKVVTENLLLHTTAGAVLIQKLQSGPEHLYEVQMPPLKRLQHKDYFYCDSGVPHVVAPISNMARFPIMKNFCQEVREHKDFQPKGTNVTLIDTTNPNKILAVTFERGVEDFTQACGTGAVAAAYYLWEKMGKSKASIYMPGGRLDIDLENLSQPKMIGPVIATGECSYEL